MLVPEIDAALRKAGSRARAVKERAYLKSELTHYGVDVPTLRRIAKAAVRAHPLDHDELIAAVEALWVMPVHERRAVAVELLVMRRELLVETDLPLIERLIREARTWVLVDGLAPAVAGPLVERFWALARVIDRWAIDPDVWVRRAALLTLLVPLREGRGDFERFGRYADAMLDDTEVFIRKAIGWVLRETSKKRPAVVAAWLLPRAARASGLTVREGSKHLPAKVRAALIASSGRAPRPAPAARPRRPAPKPRRRGAASS